MSPRVRAGLKRSLIVAFGLLGATGCASVHHVTLTNSDQSAVLEWHNPTPWFFLLFGWFSSNDAAPIVVTHFNGERIGSEAFSGKVVFEPGYHRFKALCEVPFTSTLTGVVTSYRLIPVQVAHDFSSNTRYSLYGKVKAERGGLGDCSLHVAGR